MIHMRSSHIFSEIYKKSYFRMSSAAVVISALKVNITPKSEEQEERFQILSLQEYHINCMYWDRQAWANSVDPDEMLQNAASHQGLNCLPLIQQFLDTTLGSKLYLFKFYNKYGKELRCPNTQILRMKKVNKRGLVGVFHHNSWIICLISP